MAKILLSLLIAALLLSGTAHGQQSERFDQYELHYSVVNTTFLEPQVAATYGITRSKQRAILNLAVREHLPQGGTAARSMQLKGSSWDLLQRAQQLAFQEVREGDAIYSIAEFKFLGDEWVNFKVYFRPDSAAKTYTFELKHKVYEQ